MTEVGESGDRLVDVDLAQLERDASARLVEKAGRLDRQLKPFGLYFLPGDSEFSFPGKAVEVDVFWEHFKNDRSTLEREYSHYDASSVLITVIDHVKNVAAGTIRVIMEPSPAGLRTLHDFETTPEWQIDLADIERFHGYEIDSTQIVDIATLAVRKPYRSGASSFLVSLALYHGLYLTALLMRRDYMIGALDDAVVDLQRSIGVPWGRVCDRPSVGFLGSPSTSPVILRVPDAVKEMMEHSELSRSICTGEGLSEQCSLPTITVGDAPVYPPHLDFADVGSDAMVDLSAREGERTQSAN